MDVGYAGAILKTHWDLRALAGWFVWNGGNPASRLIIFKWATTPWWVMWFGDASLHYVPLSENASIAVLMCAACKAAQHKMILSICDGTVRVVFVCNKREQICLHILFVLKDMRYIILRLLRQAEVQRICSVYTFHFIFMAACVLLEFHYITL